MAGKPKPMSQIKQLLRLHQSGWNIKSIARQLEISKNTIKSYFQKIHFSKWLISVLLEIEYSILV